jgi:phage baseplate assembly protein W
MTLGVGINRFTGEPIEGWDDVVQCLGVIFTTDFGERVMRRYFGSAVPVMLGRNMVPETFVLFAVAFGTALLWEPRVRLIQFLPLSVDRKGHASIRLDIEYRPRGHLGDFSPFGRRTIRIGPTDENYFITIETEAA